MKKTLALVGALALVLSLAGTASAREDVVIPTDSCRGIDHFPDEPIDDNPSLVVIMLTVPATYAGGELFITADGASGNISGSGVVLENGLATVRMPLTQFGEHNIVSATIVGEDGFAWSVALDRIGGSTFVVGESESTCDPDLLELAPPSIAETTTTTSTLESTTTTTTTTTTSVPESVTETTVASTSPPTTVAETTDGGGGAGWFIPIGGGLLLYIGGYLLWRKPDDPCQEELAAWMAAQAECDQATADAKAAQADCDAAKEKTKAFEDRKKEICREWPPACWDDEEGGWIEESGRPETRVTSRDLHLRKQALGEVWDRYQDGEMSAQEVEDAWNDANTPEFRENMRQHDAQSKAELGGVEADLATAKAAEAETCAAAAEAQASAEAACAKAAAAKAAYDACMGAAAAATPTPPDDGGDEGGDPPTTGGGSGPGTAPPPTDPPTAPPEEDEDEEPICCPEGNWIGYGWTTGGILGFGVESTIAHFICLCDTSRWITLASRSLRAGLALGGETSVFVAYMWGVPHVAGVPVVWAEKSGSGFDGDFALGPSISKGLKSVVKDAGLSQAGKYLKWAAKNKVPPSSLDPRKLENLRNLAPSAAGVAKDTIRGQVGQNFDPQLIVVPVGAGLQAGVWYKWCESVRVGSYESCGCTPVSWP